MKKESVIFYYGILPRRIILTKLFGLILKKIFKALINYKKRERRFGKTSESYNYCAENMVIGVAFGNPFYAQTSGFVKGKTYKLDSISVSGIKTFNEQTVISYSG